MPTSRVVLAAHCCRAHRTRGPLSEKVVTAGQSPQVGKAGACSSCPGASAADAGGDLCLRPPPWAPGSHACVRVHSTGLGQLPVPGRGGGAPGPSLLCPHVLKGTPSSSAPGKLTVPAGLASPLRAGLFSGAALRSVSGRLSPEGTELKAGKEEFFLRKDGQRHSKRGSWVITRSSAGDKFMRLIEASG